MGPTTSLQRHWARLLPGADPAEPEAKLRRRLAIERGGRPTIRLNPIGVKGSRGEAGLGCRDTFGCSEPNLKVDILDTYQRLLHRVRKKRSNSIVGITSSNTGRFSKFFQYYNLLEICNKTIKFPTTPQTRRYTTLWKTNVRSARCITSFRILLI